MVKESNRRLGFGIVFLSCLLQHSDFVPVSLGPSSITVLHWSDLNRRHRERQRREFTLFYETFICPQQSRRTHSPVYCNKPKLYWEKKTGITLAKYPQTSLGWQGHALQYWHRCAQPPSHSGLFELVGERAGGRRREHSDSCRLSFSSAPLQLGLWWAGGPGHSWSLAESWAIQHRALSSTCLCLQPTFPLPWARQCQVLLCLCTLGVRAEIWDIAQGSASQKREFSVSPLFQKLPSLPWGKCLQKHAQYIHTCLSPCSERMCREGCRVCGKGGSKTPVCLYHHEFKGNKFGLNTKIFLVREKCIFHQT